MNRILVAGLVVLVVLVGGCASGDNETDGVRAGGLAVSPTATTTPTATPTQTPQATSTLSPTEAPGESVSRATATATASPTATATAPATSAATPLDQISISLEPVVDGLRQPTGVVAAYDGSGRLFILEQMGTIRVAEHGRLLDEPFLDLTDQVGMDDKSGYFSEQGLLGLAFHPDYPENGFFFVNYTNLDGDVVISRFRVSDDPNLGDPDSESEMLLLKQPAANHNGGDLVFGPDGYLWIGTGDGGGAGDTYGNAQNGRTLLGKMLRVDPSVNPLREANYSIPPDNPFVDDPRVRDEIWATGFRNPWRYSFDRETGDLYIADVGQNLWEEINLQPAGSRGGENYGWPIMEGNHCYDFARCSVEGLARPVSEYHHQPGVCSIIGGYVYRGQRFPSLDGTYFYTDACDGVIRGLQFVGDEAVTRELYVQPGAPFSAFGEDESGELYLLAMQTGTLYRIVGR